jgi:hypothetical protein
MTMERPEEVYTDVTSEVKFEPTRRFTKAVVEAIFRKKSKLAPHPNDARALEGISAHDIDAYWADFSSPPVVARTVLSSGEIIELHRIVSKLIMDAEPSLRLAVSRRISTTSDDIRRALRESESE